MSAALLNHEIESVLSWFAKNRGIDLRDYRRETFGRGIATRMSERACRDVRSYLEVLRLEGDELDRLLSTLLIPVTSFFRDPLVFEALERHVVPDLARLAAPFPPLRAWCAGVATGEEAWSLAMLLSAAQEQPFEVLGSDLDAGSIEIGRRGRYPAAAVSLVPARFARRFLVEDCDACGVSRDALGGPVHFALHDLMGRTLSPSHAVVASFHLVVCRNVLIYFDRRLREKAIERLLSVIAPGGALVLGPVEYIPDSIEGRVRPYPGTDPALRILRVEGSRR